jgi:hypothetical protein
MAGKPLTQTNSKAVAFAIDQLTKNQMADILIDLAKRQIGVEDPQDRFLLDQIQEWFNPIAIARGDASVNLRSKHDHFFQASAGYGASYSIRWVMAINGTQKRQLRPRPPMVYQAGVQPDVMYPMSDFLIVAKITRARFATARRKAKEMGITLVRDTGTPTVLGADWLLYCQRCSEYSKPRGRAKAAMQAAAS